MEKRIHIVLFKVVLFIKALWLIGLKVTRQVVLPSRRRKGNILSSLLLLFISLTDLVANFSWGISLNSLSRWKHYDRLCFLVKKGVLVSGFLLFLLSSFEWSYPDSKILSQKDSITKAEQQPAGKSTVREVTYYSFVVIIPHSHRLPLAVSQGSYDCDLGYFTTPKIYLHYRNLRI